MVVTIPLSAQRCNVNITLENTEIADYRIAAILKMKVRVGSFALKANVPGWKKSLKQIDRSRGRKNVHYTVPAREKRKVTYKTVRDCDLKRTYEVTFSCIVKVQDFPYAAGKSKTTLVSSHSNDKNVEFKLKCP